jgi:DNA-binding NarL/FixJ family response regulator
MTISIALTDDHPVVRSGYRRILSLNDGFKVIAEFDTGEDAYFWLQKHSVDVLIMDISMPGQGGLETLRRIRLLNDKIKIMILSMHEHENMILKAFEHGANGYLSKTCDVDDLINGIFSIVAGEKVFDAGFSSVLLSAHKKALPHENLSPKEFLVMLKLAQGKTPKEVAETFNISDKTAYNYQTKIYKKLDLENSIQLMQYAELNGLLV